MAMRILITNDDGVFAPQLLALALWARKLGEVTVVAPKREQSGKSHGINLHDAFEVKQVDLASGITAYGVDSTPADCIRFARFGLNQDFDLVLSGINRGYNMGTDILYSGTAAAVFEAGVLGMRAVALSSSPEYCQPAASHLDRVFDFIFDNRLLDVCDLYNVNIPPDPGEICLTRQGGQFFADTFVNVGEDMYRAKGRCVYQDNGDDVLDTDAVMHGKISVMPLTVCRADMQAYEQLKKRGL